MTSHHRGRDDSSSMRKEPLQEIDWPDEWVRFSDGTHLVAELRRELCPEHSLYGRSVVALGRREDCDDILFQVLGDEVLFAVVHLTWRGRREPDPRWPATELYPEIHPT